MYIRLIFNNLEISITDGKQIIQLKAIIAFLETKYYIDRSSILPIFPISLDSNHEPSKIQREKSLRDNLENKRYSRNHERLAIKGSPR